MRPRLLRILVQNLFECCFYGWGILSRSTGTIGADANLNTQTSFNVAGIPVTLGDVAVNKRYLRQAVNQVVAIRNTLGASS